MPIYKAKNPIELSSTPHLTLTLSIVTRRHIKKNVPLRKKSWTTGQKMTVNMLFT